MQKVYLLLRNNQQTGPHSLEELIQLGVKKSDLIWIEGKSAGWYYPFEVDALKPYFASPAKVQSPASQNSVQTANPDNTASQKKIYVSLPGSAPKKITPVTIKSNADYIELRADQIRKKVQASIEKEATEQPIVEAPKLETPKEEVVIPKEEITPQVPVYNPLPAYHISDIAIDEVPTYTINRSNGFEKPQQEKPQQQRQKSENTKKIEKNLFSSVKTLPVEEEVPSYTASRKEYVAPRRETIALKKEIEKKEVEKKQPERKKASPFYQYAAAFIFIFVLGAGGWWFYKSFANKQSQNEIAQQPQTAHQVQQQSNTALNNTSGTTGTNPEGQTSSNDLVNTTSTTSNDFNVPLQQTNTLANQTTKPKVVKKQPDNKKQVVVQNTQPTTREEIVKEQPPVKQHEEPVTIEKKPEPTLTQEPEKKQGFFQKIGSIFKKKKKDEPTDEPKTEQRPEQKPVQQNNGERTSVKRPDAGNNLNAGSSQTNNSGGSEANITDQVDVKVSTSNNSWMIGVQGLKLTMYNRSSQMLKKAAVDVIYYNERNGVIEKKTIYFNNIAPKKSQSIAAPDHQYADHAGYKILSATGSDNGLANNK